MTWSGGFENSHMETFFFCGSGCKKLVLCLFLPANTVSLLAYNLFQCLQPLQTIYFKIFHPPPPPRQKHNGQSLSFLINKRLLKLEKIVNIITIIIIFVIIIVLAYYKNQIKKTCWQRQHEEN